MEDDGREYRVMTFVDLETKIEHWVNYIYYPDWESQAFDIPSTIEIVE